MISIAKLGSEQAKYYLEQADDRVDVADSLGSGLEDYYVDPHEARGEWAGRGAAILGLRGGVRPEHLRQLLDGIDPLTGRPLRQDGRRVSVAAFDVTFSAPKSVSVVFGTASPQVRRMVRDSHDRAVREALGYLESSAAAVRRGAGGATVETAEGFLAATFRHRASRAGDPQLHTHTVIANVARGPDGLWSALDGRRIYAYAPASSRVYQAVLRAELTRSLGVAWTPVTKGIAEIDGVPESVRREFSRRRAEIEAALTRQGTSGNRAAEAAALATRSGKDRSLGPHELFAGWRKRAEGLGWGPDRLPSQAHADQVQPAASIRKTVDELLAGERLTAKRPTFTRRDAVIALCDHLPAGAPLDADRIDGAVEQLLASSSVVPIADASEREIFRRRDGRVMRVAAEDRRYTTAALLALEQELMSAVENGRATGRGQVAEAVVQSHLEARPTLSPEQRAMVQTLTTRGDAVAVIAGRAGTGKTFALAAAHAAWTEAGHPVVGAAVARRAARELQQGAGIPSTSVAALIGGLDRGSPLPLGVVLVIDEAGMLGTRDAAALARHVERSAGKFVLVGDHRQLPELEAGGAFRGLVRRGHATELVENRRQVEVWERRAVDDLRDGRVESALAAYREHGRVHIDSHAEATRDRVVADWLAASDTDAVMIAARRSDVHDLNTRARSRLRQQGRLAGEEIRIAGRDFAVGDRIVVRRNALDLGLVNGERATVTAIDVVKRQVTLATATRSATLGERFLRSRTRNGEPALAHGYAMTCHVAQGATVDRAFVLADAGLCQEWGYTALTRGREANHLYVSRDQPWERDEYGPRGDNDRNTEPLARLALALQRSEAQPLALDSGRLQVRDHEDARGIGR
ncbi:MAG: MobF family relaxase [Solirubrobacteraceae bacterium]